MSKLFNQNLDLVMIHEQVGWIEMGNLWTYCLFHKLVIFTIEADHSALLSAPGHSAVMLKLVDGVCHEVSTG